MFKLFSNEVFEAAGDEGSAGGGGAAPAPTAQVAPKESESAPQPQEPPVAPAPAPQEPKQGQSEGDQEKVTYEPTGDPTLDYVLGYIGDKGLSQDHPAVQAAVDGDFAQLEVELLRQNDPAANQIIALAKRSYEDAQAKEHAKNEETGKALVEVAGSLEQWEEVVGWARENADDSEKGAINDMLQQGGVQAKIAARYLVEAFKAGQGNSFEGRPAVGSDAAPTQGVSKEPLSRPQFAQEAEKLYRRHGEHYMQSPEYAALIQRRRG